MSLVWTLIIGLVAGALAKLIMPGKDPGGMVITIVLGGCRLLRGNLPWIGRWMVHSR